MLITVEQRNNWKRLAEAASLDKRVIAGVLLGEPVRDSTRRLIELAAAAECITLGPDFWPPTRDDAPAGPDATTAPAPEVP